MSQSIKFFTDNVLDHSWWLNKQVEQGEFRPRPPLTFKKVEIRTAFAGVEQGDKGKLVIEKQRIRFTKNKGVEHFDIPTGTVSELFYSRVSGRRIGAAILVSPFLLFSKGRKAATRLEPR